MVKNREYSVMESEKSFYFRVDVNRFVATGHIMRSLSLAEAARRLGIHAVFVFSDCNGVEIVKNKGFEVEVLDSNWNNLNTEIDKLLMLIDKRVDVLIVDTYYASKYYLEKLSEKTRVVYIDDLGKITCSIFGLVCYAPYYDCFDYEERFGEYGTHLFLGMDYVPLREEFGDVLPRKTKKEIKRVLLLSGGADRYHIMKHLVDRLSHQKRIRIDVICGHYNNDYYEIETLYRNNKWINIYKSVEKIDEYMKNADLAISAGGTTMYELCACGTPTISYSFVDNQIDNVLAFEKLGLMDYAGDIRSVDVFSNITHLFEKNLDYGLRCERSFKMQRLLDGKGAIRIIEEICRYI